MREIKTYESFFSQHPIYRLLTLFIIGVYAENYVPKISPIYWFFALFISGLGCWTFTKSKPLIFFIFSTIFFIVLGMALTQNCISHNTIKWDSKEKVHPFIVANQYTETAKTYKVRLWLTEDNQSREIEAILLKDSCNSCPSLGDQCLIYGKIESPRNNGNPSEFDYVSYLIRNGVSGTIIGYPNEWKITKSTNMDYNKSQLTWLNSIKLKARIIQQRVSNIFADKLGANEARIVSAMTIGNKVALTKDDRDLYAQTGVSHILALSGLHLGIMVGLLSYLHFRRKWVRRLFSIGTIASIWIFTFVAGLPLSLVRATMMLSIMKIAAMTNHNRSGIIDNLGLAVAIILLLKPIMAFDVGLQLSVLSVLFIGLFFTEIDQHLKEKVKGPQWLKKVIALMFLSLIAQMATAPLVAYYFHKLPTYFLISNLLVVPLVFVILYGAMMLLILPDGIVSNDLSYGLEFVTRSMSSILKRISELPYSTFEIYPHWTTVIMLYGVMGGILLYGISRKKRLLIVTGCFMIGIGLSEVYQHNSTTIRPQIVFYNNHKSSSILFIASRNNVFLWSTDEHRETLRNTENCFWKKEHLSNPQSLKNDYKSPHILAKNNIIYFNHTKTVILDANQWEKLETYQPLKCNVLYICPTFHGHLKNVASIFNPKLVILDCNIGNYKKDKIIAEANALHWPVYDIKKKGAYIEEP